MFCVLHLQDVPDNIPTEEEMVPKMRSKTVAHKGGLAIEQSLAALDAGKEEL